MVHDWFSPIPFPRVRGISQSIYSFLPVPTRGERLSLVPLKFLSPPESRDSDSAISVLVRFFLLSSLWPPSKRHLSRNSLFPLKILVISTPSFPVPIQIVLNVKRSSSESAPKRYDRTALNDDEKLFYFAPIYFPIFFFFLVPPL